MIYLQDVLKKGTGGWKKVVAAFGEDILLPNGEVDRAKLGQIVFSDSAKRQLLNRYGMQPAKQNFFCFVDDSSFMPANKFSVESIPIYNS